MNRIGDRVVVHDAAVFIIILVSSTFLMGSSFVAGKILLSDGFPALLLVGWRFLVAALATLPLVLSEGHLVRALFPRRVHSRDIALVILIGLLQTSGVMGLLFLAMESIPASTAAILLFTNPIWVALLGRLFLKETLPPRRLAGLLCGVVGVGFAIRVGPEVLMGIGSSIGELIALGSSCCWAVATVLNKRAHLPIGPWALNFWQMLIGSLALLCLAYSVGQRWPSEVSAIDWGRFLWLAIPASTGSFGLWFMALKRGGATKASGYLFLTPLFTVILSFLVLGSPLSWEQAIGGCLIGFGLWLVNRTAPARSQQEAIAAASTEGRP
jgi:drug/metabolite transporter (DMT)-like permease